MAELRAREIAVVLCAADVRALDALIAPGHGSRVLRTGPDEILVVAAAGVADTVEREVRDRVAALDADALVLDVTDGWQAWSIEGDDAVAALSYVTALRTPAPGDWAQGDVARVGSIVLRDEHRATILVPAYHGDHIRERVLGDASATEARR